MHYTVTGVSGRVSCFILGALLCFVFQLAWPALKHRVSCFSQAGAETLRGAEAVPFAGPPGRGGGER